MLLAGEPCIDCHHAPHADSSPNNPGGCSVIINEFRRETCNCPRYRAPGSPPRQRQALIVMDLWPPCPWNDGSHPVEQINETEVAGGVNIEAYCCGRRETLFVPTGCRLQRTLFGLKVVGMPAVQQSAVNTVADRIAAVHAKWRNRTCCNGYADQTACSTGCPKQTDLWRAGDVPSIAPQKEPTPDQEVDKSGRFGLLEID